MPKAVILGAGITGLTTAWKLAENGTDVLVIEREPFIGGMATTFAHKDYRLDLGPHKLFTLLEIPQREMVKLFGADELLAIPKKSRIRLRGKYLKFPVALKDALFRLGPLMGIRLGTSYFWSAISGRLIKRTDGSYSDWIRNRFGSQIYKLIFAPMARKTWGAPEVMSSDLARTRVAIPSLLELLRQMLFPNRKGRVISAERFLYPKEGIVAVSQKMAEAIRACGGRVLLSVEPTAAILREGRIAELHFSNGETVELQPGDNLISTIPFQRLLSILSPAPADEIVQTANRLQYRQLILFYAVVNRDRLIDDNWIFFPESRYRFNRIFEQKAFSSDMVPQGKTVLCVEIPCSHQEAIWSWSDAELSVDILASLEEAELLTSNEVEEVFTRRISEAYPLYDLDYRLKMEKVFNWLDGIPNLYSVGRQGSFSYTGMMDSMDIGITTAGFIAEKRSRGEWNQVRQKFYDYVVID